MQGMGICAMLPPEPAYQAYALAQQNAATRSLQGAQQFLGDITVDGKLAVTTPAQAQGPRIGVRIMVSDEKPRRQINTLIDALPTSICMRIMRIDFVHAFGTNPAHFLMVFDNKKEVSFANIDDFPTEKDIAYIGLACP